jgi:uroporphyrinogen-III decarboxylase
VIGLQTHIGLFQALGVGDWASFADVLVLMADDPGLVRETMQQYADFVIRITQGILDQVEVDYVSFSEPIGSTEGPLISPPMYRDLALASYRPILDAFTRRGIETFVFATYGNARLLLPDILDAGFNALWAMEAETRDMDYRDLRREFGRELRLIGGIDLDRLMQGPDAIRRERSEKVPPLLKSGGYIPLADGRVRRQFPFEYYVYYREQLEETIGVGDGTGGK